MVIDHFDSSSVNIEQQIVQRSLAFSKFLRRIIGKFLVDKFQIEIFPSPDIDPKCAKRKWRKKKINAEKGLAERKPFKFPIAALSTRLSSTSTPPPFNNLVTSGHARPFKFATFAFTFAGETLCRFVARNPLEIHISRYRDCPRAAQYFNRFSLSLSLLANRRARPGKIDPFTAASPLALEIFHERKPRKPRLSGSLDLARRAGRRPRDKRRAIYLSLAGL